MILKVKPLIDNRHTLIQCSKLIIYSIESWKLDFRAFVRVSSIGLSRSIVDQLLLLQKKLNSVAAIFYLEMATAQPRDGNSAAYVATRCCWCTAPRSVATKICISSQRQRSAAYYNFLPFFTIIAGKLFFIYLFI